MKIAIYILATIVFVVPAFFLLNLKDKPKERKAVDTAVKSESPQKNGALAKTAPVPQVEAAKTQAPKANPPTGFCLNVPILYYHHIEPLALAKEKGHTKLSVGVGYFEQQASYLASSGYNTITVEQLAQALINHQSLPPKSIAITADDGYEDIYTYTYPIIQKYHLTINLMIPTGLVGNPGYLTWSQLKEMVDSGLVVAYDHTWSHASLVSLPKEKIQFEILTAKKQLEENLEKPVNIFTYPYGSENSQVVEILKRNGFIAALSTVGGTTQCDSFIMSLHRTRIGNFPLTTYRL